MSKKGRRAVILTNEGDFKSVRLKRAANLSIGQTVLSKHLAQFNLLPGSFLTPIIALGISVLCFIPLSHSTYAPSGPVAAYVYFDLKASIEASVDRNMHVISVQPLNNEAKKILSETSVFQNMTFSELSTALLSKLGGDKRDADKGSLCLVTTVLTDQISHKQQTEFTQKLINAFDSGAKQLRQVNGSGVEWLRTSVERKKIAEKRGLSAGKYLLYLRANAYGKTLSLEDARRFSVEKMQEVSGSVSLPWSALLNESAGQMNSQLHIDQASFKGRQVQSLFRNPFQSVEPIQSRQDSSYHYWNSRVLGYA